GVLGCGAIARSVHLPILSKLTGVRVVALADADEINRTRAAVLFPEAATYADFSEAIRDASVDAVIIALPTGLHARAACAAFAAGKHVYLEKPLATSPQEGQQVLESWHNASDCIGMIGFNYRFNPLLAEAREVLQRGGIGRLTAIRSVFATPMRETAPGWKKTRSSGGGALLDLASHHFDLLRFLSGREIEEISAGVSSRHGDADSASVQLRLADGVLAQTFVSLCAADDDRWEFYGENGRLVVDRYDGVSGSEVTPARREESSPLSGLQRGLRDAGRQGYRLRKRAMPGHEPSFTASLTQFVAAIRGDAKLGSYPDLEDGYRSLEIVAAAEESARQQSRMVSLASATLPPPAPANVDLPTRILSPGADESSKPELSVILVSPDNYETVRRTILYLQRQTVAARIEVIVVLPGRKAAGIVVEDFRPFASWQILEVGPIHALAPVKVRAIHAARAPYVVEGEDHAFPEPDWAENLIQALRAGNGAVGPSVTPANPRSALSWTCQMLHYGPWTNPGAPREIDHIAWHNGAFRRELLLQFDDAELCDLLSVESFLHSKLSEQGHRVYLQSDARLRHVNFSNLNIALWQGFWGGRLFGATRVRREGWGAIKKAVHVLTMPLTPLVRLHRIFPMMTEAGLKERIPQVLPTMIPCLITHALGEVTGYLFGAGESEKKFMFYETRRIDLITADDRADIEREMPFPTPASSSGPSRIVPSKGAELHTLLRTVSDAVPEEPVAVGRR
ncbi:MAG: Gfo/Idh/MocA family oxidoreductase, partial [Akkermansiaceae bacterium]|nr:Gfo/Idh/MocA family oxidoreductase [Armatimonadota bacterium]